MKHQQRFGSSQQRYVNRMLFLSTWKVVPSVHVTTTCCNKVCQVAGEQISFAQVQGQQSLSITAGLGPQGFEVVDLPVVDQNHLKHNASLVWIFHQVDTLIQYILWNPEIPSALLFADTQLMTSILSLHCPANHTTELYECHKLRLFVSCLMQSMWLHISHSKEKNQECHRKFKIPRGPW